MALTAIVTCTAIRHPRVDLDASAPSFGWGVLRPAPGSLNKRLSAPE